MARMLVTVIVLLTAALSVVPCHADTIRLSGGRVVSGVVETETSSQVTIRTGEGLVSFPRSQIQQVQRAAPADRLRVQAELAARSGKFAAFLREQSGVTSGIATENIDPIIAQQAENLAREFGRAPAADVVLLTAYLTDRPTSAPASVRVAMARIQAERRQFAEASRWLRDVNPDALTPTPDLQAWAVGFLKEQIRQALQNNEPEFGLECLAHLARLAPEAVAKSTSVPLVLARSSQLAAQGLPTEAIRVLKVDLEPMSSAIAFQEALRIARKALEEAEDHERIAILRAFLYSFQGEQYDGESRDLLHQLAQLLIAQGEFAEARKIALRLGAVDADAAASFEHRIEFEMRRRETDANDPLSIYRLGCWAAERGLQEEARTMLRQAAKAPELRENAELHLQAMQLAIEREEFDRLVAAFEARDFPSTIKKAATFRQMYPASTLLQRVRTMEEVARFQLERQARLAPQQADALYQNAERLYYQGRYRDAIEILNRLDSDFAGTPATRRGAQLRAAIFRREPNLSALVSSTTGSVVAGPSSVRAAVSRAAYLGEVTSLLLQMNESQANQP